MAEIFLEAIVAGVKTNDVISLKLHEPSIQIRFVPHHTIFTGFSLVDGTEIGLVT